MELKLLKVIDNLPVRKKFLKSGSIEGSRIADIVEKIALSKKNISFKFIQDRVEKFSGSGDNNLKNIVYTLYGKNVYDNVIELDYNYSGIKINGVIGNTNVNLILKYLNQINIFMENVSKNIDDEL